MKIRFEPTGQEVDVDPNKSLLDICNDNKIPIRSVCHGVPSCGECRIRVVSGDHNLLPPGKAELSLIGTNYFLDQRRLSCQLRCFGDVVIDISRHLGPDDSANRKIRGHRATDRKHESKAVQDTFVLKDQPVTRKSR
jgi:ferredoxin, 2Fe-2S